MKFRVFDLSTVALLCSLSLFLISCSDSEISLSAGPVLKKLIDNAKTQETLNKEEAELSKEASSANLDVPLSIGWTKIKKEGAEIDAIRIYGSLFNLENLADLKAQSSFPSTTSGNITRQIAFSSNASKSLDLIFDPSKLMEDPRAASAEVPILIQADVVEIKAGQTLKTDGRDLFIAANRIKIDGKIRSRPAAIPNFPGRNAGNIYLSALKIDCGSTAEINASGAEGGKIIPLPSTLTFEQADAIVEEVKRKVKTQEYIFSADRKINTGLKPPTVTNNIMIIQLLNQQDAARFADSWEEIRAEARKGGIRALEDEFPSPDDWKKSDYDDVDREDVIKRVKELSKEATEEYWKDGGKFRYAPDSLYVPVVNDQLAMYFPRMEKIEYLVHPIPLLSPPPSGWWSWFVPQPTEEEKKAEAMAEEKVDYPVELIGWNALPGGNGGRIEILSTYQSLNCPRISDAGESSQASPSFPKYRFPTGFRSEIVLKNELTERLKVFYHDDGGSGDLQMEAGPTYSVATKLRSVPIRLTTNANGGVSIEAHPNDPGLPSPGPGHENPSLRSPEELLKAWKDAGLQISEAQETLLKKAEAIEVRKRELAEKAKAPAVPAKP